MKSIPIINLAKISANTRTSLLTRKEANLTAIKKKVAPIIADVKRNGDKALIKYAKKYNLAKLTSKGLIVSKQEFIDAEKSLDKKIKATLYLAAKNIYKFHKHQYQKTKTWKKEINKGVVVSEKYTPIESVAIYCPQGKGNFPSVALMGLIPARIAKVPNLILLTPPNPDGKVDPATLYAAKIAGVSLVAKVGGAQAIAAAAYGTKSIPKCDKIEGPGSLFVVAAKELLAKEIYSRLPAGPSESIIFADASANYKKVALDVLIEAEHGSDSSVFLVTTSKSLASKVQSELPKLLKLLSPRRRKYAHDVLTGNNGGIIYSPKLQLAVDFINDYAPEHLQIMAKKANLIEAKITNAAEILIGENTPGSIANYCLGPNCILPTNAKAKVHSSLSVFDFQKRSTIAKIKNYAYPKLAKATYNFAKYEGFDAHANAVSSLRD